MGDKVRYNGTDKLLLHPAIQQWQSQQRIIPLCPEVAGGLPVPRPPAEIQKNGVILTSSGTDVTKAFEQGAQRALALCQQHHIKYALLKARSPSCGNEEVYNGEFSGEVKPGAGVTATLLKTNGIRVFNETQIDELAGIL